MSKYWLDYVKSCYDLVVESQGITNVVLDHEIEAYVVHLMANNFERTNIGAQAVAIQMLSAVQTGKRQQLLEVADECLIIHSYPFKKTRWPSPSYYKEIGTTAYGLAGHVMEDHFVPAAVVMNAIFSRKTGP